MGEKNSFALNECDHFVITCVKSRGVQDCFGIATLSMRKELQSETWVWGDMENTKKIYIYMTISDLPSFIYFDKSFAF